ncbi:MAG TPA: GNAT family N-acetyltransferase [Pyrinomonadaceae bacterium]|nr:GNAT family N-acetyltransferase [Pyrinomonadaceae bacterium]
MTRSASLNGSVHHAIRFAKPSDADELAQLRYALRASTGRATEPEEDFIKRCAIWMRDHLKTDEWQCVVAEVNEQLVGALWVQLVEKIPNPRAEAEHHAYITNFYVQEDTRGTGIGSRLLRAALDWCSERDVHAVILWPTERSRSLYERFGFAVRDDIMELIVKSPQ